MRIAIQALLFLSFLGQPMLAESRQFFESAVRRDPTSPREMRPIVRLSNGCTGFFVKNTGNRPLIATARHCVGYQLTDACKNGSLRVVTHGNYREGTCKQLIASTAKLDMAIFEATFANWDQVSKEIDFLQLSSQRPRIGTKLKMIGYPSDPVRNGHLTVTENCQVSGGRMVDVPDFPQEDQTVYLEWLRLNERPDPLGDLIKNRFLAFHNCSVYGGNSGGPILVHGTPIVLGMPTSYFPNTKNAVSSNLSTGMDSTAVFSEVMRRNVRAAGIVLAKPYARGEYRAPYKRVPLTDGTIGCYRTDDVATAVHLSLCEEELTPE